MPKSQNLMPLPHNAGHGPAAKYKMKRHIAKYLESVACDAAQHIYDTMRDPNMPPDLRLRAAFDIMDRTQGKAISKVDQKVVDEVEEQREMPSLDSIPTERLESILRQLEAPHEEPEFDIEG